MKSRKKLFESYEDEHVVWVTQSEFNELLTSVDPNKVAEKDYVDPDTGEIYLEFGKAFKTQIHEPEAPSMSWDDLLDHHRELYRTAVDEFVANIDVEDLKSMIGDDDISSYAYDLAQPFLYSVQHESWFEDFLVDEDLTEEDVIATIAEEIAEKFYSLG